ncbi:MAG: hypothetical protein ACFB03_16205 [Paracoccaceae bacterium]
MHDYSETRECLTRARTALAEAHLAAGRTNLPPISSPRSIRLQIDEVERILREAAFEIEAARAACTEAGRRGLSVV